MWMSVPAVRAAAGRVPRDVVLAAGLLIAAQAELIAVGPVDRAAVAVLAAFGLSVPFAWWHRRPLPVLAAVMATILTQTAAGVAPNAQVVVPVVWALASFGVAAFAPLRTALAGLPTVAVPLATLMAIGGVIPTLSDLLYASAVFTLVPWVMGRVYRASRNEALEHARRAALAEADVERLAALVLETERRRIARELHDIIAHSLSLMVLQAGAAGEVLDRSPERARDALSTVQDTGRQALTEMKRLLAVLRTPDTNTSRQPQPGLADLDALVEQVRDTGLAVYLTVEVDAVQVPAGIELSLYRVVQEALTNVIKHATAGRAEVCVRAGIGYVEAVVTDDGRGAAGTGGNGHGLVGMRERVALYHGEFRAGSGPDGYAVRARFPLDGHGRVQ